MKQRLGKWGEEQAAVFLVKKGYKLIEKNWRSRPGEIDLIMRDQEMLVFVEVKTRSGTGFGYPEEAITENKIDVLLEACQKYIDEKELNIDWRIDIISIIGDPKSGIKEIEHIIGFEN